MGLTLITGRANSGKTAQVLSRALEAASIGQAPHLVVPTPADVGLIEEALTQMRCLGIHVSTFAGLVEELWMLNGNGRRPVGRSTRAALIQRVVARQRDSMVVETANTPGTCRLLERVVSGSPPETKPALAPSTRVLGRIVELVHDYASELDRLGFVESSWLTRLLAEKPLRMEGPLLLAGFDILEADRAELLKGLSRDNDVTVSLLWERSFAPTAINDAAVVLLGAPPAEHVCASERSSNSELGRVDDGLFGPPIGLRSEGHVVLGEAAGTYAEDSLVAQLVREELRRGVPAKRLAVVCRSAGSRATHLTSALTSVGVRSYAEVWRTVPSTRFGRAFSALLSLALGGGSRIDAASLLLGPFCDLERHTVEALDRGWRAGRVSTPQLLVEDVLKAGGSVSEALGLALQLADMPIEIPVARKWEQVLNILLCAPSEMVVGGPVASGEREDAAAHRSILGAVSEMASTEGHPFKAQELALALPSLQLSLPVIETEGIVQIIDADAVGSRRFDVLVMMDLTASGFSLAERESLEGELRRLAGAEPASSADRGRNLFYSLVTKARQRLYLVRQECNAEGEPVAPSPALEALLDLYRDKDADPDSAPLAPPEVVSAPLGDVAASSPVFGLGRREQRVAASNMSVRTVERGAIDAESFLERMRERQVFSATEVEAYLRCPYHWFYEHIVRPTEIDFEFDGRELGTRAHACLATFYSRLPEELGEQRVTSGVLAQSLELFDRLGSRMTPRTTEGMRLDEELATARALLWARRAVVDDAEMFPTAEQTEPEVVFVGVPFAGAHFKGRIDRLDVGPSAVFVTDYKVSSTVYGLGRFEAQGLIQAVLYSVAAEERTGVPPAASLYRSLRSRTCRGFWRADLLGEAPALCSARDAVSAAAFSELVERTEERVALALAGIRAGREPRSPRAGACRYCSIAKICQESAA